MTEDEMRAVVRVTNQADSGCPDCARLLASYLIDAFPDFLPVIRQEWEQEFGLDFDPPKVIDTTPVVLDKPIRF